MKNSFKKLIEIVSNSENVSIDEIYNKRTDSGYRCRNIISYILYFHYGFTFREIANFLDKNTSTISKSYIKFAFTLDPDYKKYILKLKLLLDEQLID